MKQNRFTDLTMKMRVNPSELKLAIVILSGRAAAATGLELLKIWSNIMLKILLPTLRMN